MTICVELSYHQRWRHWNKNKGFEWFFCNGHCRMPKCSKEIWRRLLDMSDHGRNWKLTSEEFNSLLEKMFDTTNGNDR